MKRRRRLQPHEELRNAIGIILIVILLWVVALTNPLTT